jgi:hypothetical protein
MLTCDVCIILLTSVDITAARKCSSDNEEGLRNVVESDNECSDFSVDETESEESSSGSDYESSEQSDEKNDNVPGPSKHIRTTTQKKQSDWKWTKLTTVLLSTPLPKTVEFVITHSSKSEAEPPSELFFKIYGTFV